MCVCLCVHGCTYYICTHAKRSHIHVKDPVVHVTRHQSLVAYGNIKQESNPVCTKNTTGQQDCFRVYNCDKYRRDHFISESVSWFGPAVRCYAGKRKDLGPIPLRLSFLFKKVVVCGSP